LYASNVQFSVGVNSELVGVLKLTAPETRFHPSHTQALREAALGITQKLGGVRAAGGAAAGI